MGVKGEKKKETTLRAQFRQVEVSVIKMKNIEKI
jgi:hypothetical protein